jgi:hypothetical protein
MSPSSNRLSHYRLSQSTKSKTDDAKHLRYLRRRNEDTLQHGRASNNIVAVGAFSYRKQYGPTPAMVWISGGSGRTPPLLAWGSGWKTRPTQRDYERSGGKER